MLKAQLDLSVPCPHTQDFEPCMGPGCSDEGECLFEKTGAYCNCEENKKVHDDVKKRNILNRNFRVIASINVLTLLRSECMFIEKAFIAVGHR